MAESTPTTHGNYGLSGVSLANATLESVTKTDQTTFEPITNQVNQVVKEVKVDQRVDLRLTYRGSAIASGTKLTFDDVDYLVDSCEEAGVYNGLVRYNLLAHRYENQTIA